MIMLKIQVVALLLFVEFVDVQQFAGALRLL